MTGLAAVVKCDLVSYNEIDLVGGATQTIFEPALVPRPQLEDAFAGLIDQHPLVRHYAQTRDPQPLRMSDFIALDELKALDIYAEVFRPLETNYQLAFSLAIDADVVIGIGLNRYRRDFSERDMTVMGHVQKQLSHAFRHAKLKDRYAADRQTAAQIEELLSRLTPREREIAALIADGGTNAGIAQTLFLSRRTVEVHAANLLAKLGLGSRSAVAALFARRPNA